MSEILKTVLSTAADMYASGLISAARMDEYVEKCTMDDTIAVTVYEPPDRQENLTLVQPAFLKTLRIRKVSEVLGTTVVSVEHKPDHPAYVTLDAWVTSNAMDRDVRCPECRARIL